MTYPSPTGEQTVIIAVAMIAPLVWAFTHHGGTRKTTLMLWVPLLLFVTRVVHMNPRPTAPLEVRLRWAAIDALMDPMTIAWPAFVVLIYFLIWLFTAPRRRREAKAMRAVVDAQRQSPTPQALVQTVPVQSSPRYTTCRHCGTAAASPHARYCSGCGIELGYDPSQRSQEV